MTKKYEGMFLFDPTATPDWEACRAELDRLMDRIGAQVIVANKWDERRLAYEIRGRKRGIYGLTFFEAEPSKLAELERDTNLSEAVLRVLILKADHLSEEEMKEAAASRPTSALDGDDASPRTPEGVPDKPTAKPKEDSVSAEPATDDASVVATVDVTEEKVEDKTEEAGTED